MQRKRSLWKLKPLLHWQHEWLKKKKKKVRQPYSYQESLTRLDKTSSQPQHSLKPKPSPEEGSHASFQSLPSCLSLCDPMDCKPRFFCPSDSPGSEMDGLPCPPLGDLPDWGRNPRLLCLLHWQANPLPLSRLRSPEEGPSAFPFSEGWEKGGCYRRKVGR